MSAAAVQQPGAGLWDAMLERVAKRRRLWTVIEDDVVPDPAQLGETCIVGTLSICALESRRRFILAPACIPIPEFRSDTSRGLETPTSLARDYLTIIYRRSPNIMHKQVEFLRAHTAPLPLWAEPCYFRAGYYLDIVSAYFTLLMLYGWNVDYWPGRWLAGGRPPFDFPWPERSLARNSLVSAGVSKTVQVYKPGTGYMTVKTGNHLANLQMFCLICDTLNAVAREMVDYAGAVYVNTDGYILKDFSSLTKAIEVLKGWRLPAHVKYSGAGYVRGAGAYKFAGGRPQKKLDQNKAIYKIAPLPWAAWLKDRAVSLRERRDTE